MSFFIDNMIVWTIAAVLGSFAWIWGGTRGDLLLSFVPWLTLIMFEAMMAFPQRMHYETLSAARLRVWRTMRADPLTIAIIGFLVLLLVPFFNQTFPALPWCVNRMTHLNVYLWFLPSLLAMLAAKHALRRHGKRLLAEVLVWNGVAVAALGFLQLFSGARGPYWSELRPGLVFFSTFAYPNMAGDYFTSLTFLAIGLWRWRLSQFESVDENRYSSYQLFWNRHYHLIAVAILYFAALNTLSRSAILLSTCGVAILFVMAGMQKLKRLHRADRVKFSAVLFFVVIGISLFALMFTPDSMRKELNSLDAEVVLDRMAGKKQYHNDVARQLLKDYPAFGCGGWRYMFLSPQKIPPEIAKGFIDKNGKWSTGTANVHNDYLQFACEHGLLGFALLVTIVFIAVFPVAGRWRRMARTAHFTRHSGLPWPKGLFCFPPIGLAIYLSAAATLIHAFADCPLRSPAVLSLFFVQLVLIDGFLPREDNSEE